MNTTLEIKNILSLYLNQDLSEYILHIIKKDIIKDALNYWISIVPPFISSPFYTKDIYLLEHIRRINGNIYLLKEELNIIKNLRINNKLLDKAWNSAICPKDNFELLCIYQHICNVCNIK